jgi:hypothetical protein
MELTTEQRRIVNQVRKHVSSALADEIRLYFMRGGDDLRGIIIQAAEERKAEAGA